MRTRDEALKLVQQAVYELALLDVNLKEHPDDATNTNGLELARTLLESASEVAIIFISRPGVIDADHA